MSLQLESFRFTVTGTQSSLIWTSYYFDSIPTVSYNFPTSVLKEKVFIITPQYTTARTDLHTYTCKVFWSSQV